MTAPTATLTDHYDETASRVADTIATLRELEIPAEFVHSISVEFWGNGTAVQIHIDGASEETVALVDRIAEHYGLAEADPDSGNYARGQHLGQSPVHVYCGRPESK